MPGSLSRVEIMACPHHSLVVQVAAGLNIVMSQWCRIVITTSQHWENNGTKKFCTIVLVLACVITIKNTTILMNSVKQPNAICQCSAQVMDCQTGDKLFPELLNFNHAPWHHMASLGHNELKTHAPVCSVWLIDIHTGLILGLPPSNERRRYKVTPSLIGWAQT